MNNSTATDGIATEIDRQRLQRKILAALILGASGDGEKVFMPYDYGRPGGRIPRPRQTPPGADEWDFRIGRAYRVLTAARRSAIMDLRDKRIISVNRAARLLACLKARSSVEQLSFDEGVEPCGDIVLCPNCYARAVAEKIDGLEIFSPATAGKPVYFFSSFLPFYRHMSEKRFLIERNFILTRIAEHRPAGAGQALIGTSVFPTYETNCLGFIRIGGVMAPFDDEGNESPFSGSMLSWHKVNGGDISDICAKLAGIFSFPSHVFFPHEGRPDLHARWVRMARLTRNVNALEVVDTAALEPYIPNIPAIVTAILTRLSSQGAFL